MNETQMADLETELAKHESAEDYFAVLAVLDQLIKANPDNLELLYKSALHSLKTGQVDQAESLLQTCVHGGFENPMLYLNLGHVYKAQGKSDLAAQCYQRLVDDCNDAHAAIGYWSQADLKDFLFDEKSILQLQERLEGSLAKPGYKGLMLFAFAYAMEQKKDYASAIAALIEANDIVAKSRPFRGDLYGKYVSSMVKDFRSSAPLKNEGASPILIVGMPRSGTTLVEQILAGHSRVEATDELPYFERIGLELEKASGYASGLSGIDIEAKQIYASSYLASVEPYRRDKLDYFIDKNPTNFLHIGLAKTLFPDVKIINVVRDPLDNAMSVFKQYFNRGNDFSFTMEGIVYYWQGYLTLMRRWQELYAGDIYHLSYEELARNPEKKIRELLRHCDLAEEPGCFRFYESDRPVLTPSSSQVRNPISTRSVGSGLKYQQFIKPFVAQLAQIKSKAREELGV